MFHNCSIFYFLPNICHGRQYHHATSSSGRLVVGNEFQSVHRVVERGEVRARRDLGSGLADPSSIFHRPRDPVEFCKSLLEQKLKERGEEAFLPEQTTAYAREFYENVADYVDPDGTDDVRSGDSSTISSASDA